MACSCTKAALAVLIALLAAIAALVIQHPKEIHPDVGKTIQQLISSRGFEHETHWIQSADGYLLQTIRIVNPTVKNRAQLKPILLHHGFQCSGNLWLVAADGKLEANGKYIEQVHEKTPNAVGNSLGFVLATQGYDVWLANYRGNIYSRNHTTLKPDEDQFWKYSIDDMIKYDLPAQIEYIRKKTNRKTISYIGHSQGNYMMLGLLASQPQYSQIIKPHIALSPVSYFTSFEAAMGYMRYFRKQLLQIHPHDWGTNLFRTLRIPQACTNPLIQKNVCYYLLWYLFGTPRSQLDWERMPVYFDSVLAGAATRNYVHFLQHDSSPKQYSYEDEEPGRNAREYGNDFPPIYNYGKINSTDIAIIYTKRDWFNHMADIHLLKEHLNVKLLDDYQVPDDSWNHMELVWAKDVGKLVNTKILELLKKY